MTTSSEDVLLQVGQVRYKKGDGTLYVMNERIAWMMDHRDTVSVSHRYTDIKMQKISPEGKPKVQLQLVLHDGSATTFHFVNRMGQPAQVKDRDSVKDVLQQLLTKFRREVDKELEEKNRLLTENPSLLQLYKDLVITQVITSEEFWSQHASKYTRKQQTQHQDIGISGAFLADIKPQTDGCNGLKYNLTADIIECIFKTYPAVYKKHLEYVPHKLTESEFWTKFFQSHYFHRDRINAGSKDLFTECAKMDEQELKKDITAGIDDPLVDISSFEDKTLDEGYGTGVDKSSNVQSGNIVHQNMIKRFNHHSIMVLKACQQKNMKSADTTSNDKSKSSATVNGPSASSHSSDNNLHHKSKKMRIQEKIMYDDLEEDSTSVNPATTSVELNLAKVERYLHGPVPVPAGNEPCDDNVVTTLSTVQDEINSWAVNHKQKPRPLIHPAAAVSALGELTPGGELMKGFLEDSLSQLVPSDLERDFKNLYMSLCELLRHFWACFPPTTPNLETKASQMNDALRRFHSARLKPFEDRVMREHSPLSQNLTSHLNQLLNAAYHKFGTWQQRRIQQSLR